MMAATAVSRRVGRRSYVGTYSREEAALVPPEAIPPVPVVG